MVVKAFIGDGCYTTGVCAVTAQILFSIMRLKPVEMKRKE